MHLLVTRPEPDASKFSRELKGLGHEISLEPLTEITFSKRTVPNLDGAQAVVVTSRNALRAVDVGGGCKPPISIPLFAVGPATASLAKEMGVKTIIEGPGSAQDLFPLITERCQPDAGLIVHLSGRDIAIDLAGPLKANGFLVERHILYSLARRTDFSAQLQEKLRVGDIQGVVLMSPLTARVYANLIKKHGLETAVQKIIHFCLSKKVAQQLSDLGQHQSRVPPKPNGQEILALIQQEAALLD